MWGKNVKGIFAEIISWELMMSDHTSVERQFVYFPFLVVGNWFFNSLAPEGFDYDMRLVVFKLILGIDILINSCEVALRWMSQNPIDD